jgi:hypothetical protein
VRDVSDVFAKRGNDSGPPNEANSVLGVMRQFSGESRSLQLRRPLAKLHTQSGERPRCWQARWPCYPQLSLHSSDQRASKLRPGAVLKLKVDGSFLILKA